MSKKLATELFNVSGVPEDVRFVRLTPLLKVLLFFLLIAID